MSEALRSPSASSPSPFVEISRADWAALTTASDLSLSQSEIEQIRGLGDFLDLQEINDV